MYPRSCKLLDVGGQFDVVTSERELGTEIYGTEAQFASSVYKQDQIQQSKVVIKAH